jgi:hypothetical protein
MRNTFVPIHVRGNEAAPVPTPVPSNIREDRYVLSATRLIECAPVQVRV